MSPLDDELRSLFHARADGLAPSPDPTAGIERRAKRMRRNRVAASVAGTALAVTAIAIAVPALRPDSDGGPTQFAPPGPSAPATVDPTAPVSPGNGLTLDPRHPWAYRGDTSLIAGDNLTSLRSEWAGKHPGSSLTPLFGQIYPPSNQPEIVFVASSQGNDRWGVATSSHAGWEFSPELTLPADSRVLMTALPGDEVPRLLIVASPKTGQISYAPDGTTWRDYPGPEVGVAFMPLEGDTSKDKVRVLDGNGDLGNPVFVGSAPDAGNAAGGVAPTSTTPANLLGWAPRGSSPSTAALDEATAAFAQSVGAKVADVGTAVLFGGHDKAGRELVLLQAWIHGSDAHTFGWARDGKGFTEPFLGPVTGKGPALLAYVVSAGPGQNRDTLVLLPQPGAGAVSYAPSASARYTVVASGRSDLNPVGVIERDPKATADRVKVQQADGSTLFEGPVQPLLCGASSCG
jgi:hypothetical protein